MFLGLRARIFDLQTLKLLKDERIYRRPGNFPQ